MGNFIEEKAWKSLDWQLYSPRLHVDIPQSLKLRLTDTGSLSRHLSGLDKNFRVSVLSERWAYPDVWLANRLSLASGDKAWCRQVNLLLDNECYVYGETWVPDITAQAMGDKLFNLGSKPIGELLFDSKDSQRADFFVAKMSQIVKDTVSDNELQQVEWARQSLFLYQKKPLVIFEIFSPERCYEPSNY